jgi:cellobiose phosphorylase
LAAEGFEVMNDVYSIATNQDVAKNFPGIPSFFDAENRGAYAYLTGSSSWYLLTLTTQMFGIRGEEGNLAICPKLMAKQFDVNGKTSISLYFQNKRLHIEYQNPELFDYNEYSIGTLSINGTIIDYHKKGKACAIIDKTKLEELLTNNENRITVTLINQ